MYGVVMILANWVWAIIKIRIHRKNLICLQLKKSFADVYIQLRLQPLMKFMYGVLMDLGNWVWAIIKIRIHRRNSICLQVKKKCETHLFRTWREKAELFPHQLRKSFAEVHIQLRLQPIMKFMYGVLMHLANWVWAIIKIRIHHRNSIYQQVKKKYETHLFRTWREKAELFPLQLIKSFAEVIVQLLLQPLMKFMYGVIMNLANWVWAIIKIRIHRKNSICIWLRKLVAGVHIQL